MADLQDDELYLPRTVVNKLIKEMVPNIRVSTDARDLLLNCCSEFIHLLASEASEASERQQKKVISPDHVLEALSTLGFPEYIEDVKAVYREYREQASKHRRRGKSRLERLGIPEEELLRQQQQLFEEARQQQLENDMLEQQAQTTPLPTPSQVTPITSPQPPSLSPAQPPSSTTPVPTQPLVQQTGQQAPGTAKLQASSAAPSLLPANLQATASLLQSLTAGQVRPASLPHLLPLNPSVLQAMQAPSPSLLQQASQTANLLQAARATELLRQQVAAQQASLAAVHQQQLKILQQQQLRGREGGEGGEEERGEDK